MVLWRKNEWELDEDGHWNALKAIAVLLSETSIPGHCAVHAVSCSCVQWYCSIGSG